MFAWFLNLTKSKSTIRVSIRGLSIKFRDCVRCVSYDVIRENPITSSCYAICAEYMNEILTLYCYSVIFDAVSLCRLGMSVEQRTNPKLLVRLGKLFLVHILPMAISPWTMVHILSEVYGQETMSRSRVFEWHKRFKEGREEVEDDARSGRPSSSRTEDNVERVRQKVREDRRMTVRMVAYELGINRETVWKIITEDLEMRKLCAKMVPKLLNNDQKDRRLQVCQDILGRLQTQPNLLEKVITGDESWIFEYDPETKRQSLQWKSPGSPRISTAWLSLAKVKLMLIAFFDVRGIVHTGLLPQGQTVNQHVYKDVLRRLIRSVRDKRRELWVNDSWLLHHDNAPAHNALSVRQFLAEKNIPVLEQPPYSPDLAPCDFFFFPKLKQVQKGHILEMWKPFRRPRWWSSNASRKKPSGIV